MAQTELILSACKNACISPDDLNYIECHGTGTKIGDPIEVNGLVDALGKRKSPYILVQ